LKTVDPGWVSLPNEETEMNQNVRAATIGIRNILLGANLRSLSKLVRPDRLAFYSTQTLFFYDCLFRRGLPVKNVKDVLPHGEYTDVTFFLESDDFWINDMPSGGSDLVSLGLITRLVRPKRIFEIGTARGYTALQFAANAPDAEVFTLDLPRGSSTALPITVMDEVFANVERGTSLNGKKEAGRIHRLLGDSATFDFSAYSNKIDLFFIDGAHTYEYVKNDTLKALACCHPGSVITWHDYGRRGINGVTRWLNEFVKSHFPVYRVPNGSLAYGIIP
jgi:Methyltransferase domain